MRSPPTARNRPRRRRFTPGWFPNEDQAWRCSGMQEVSIAFGGPPVLDRASLYIERGERVCLLGRNGAGKTTLMKVLDGTIAPDSGTVVRETGASVARLEQDVSDDVAGSTFAAGFGQRRQLLARYHDASHRVSVEGTEAALREIDRLLTGLPLPA